MLRLAKNEDLFPGRKVLPCHNLASANWYINHSEDIELSDWQEWEDTQGNYFVVKDEAGYN